MKIDKKAIKDLATILDETGLTEIEVSEGDQIIRIARGGMVVSGHAPVMAAPVANMASDPAETGPANTSMPSTVAQNHPGAVTSPMVGTAYLQPEPGADVFVRKGQNVQIGDTLLIIEAMKVMNPIKADRAGVVTQILVESGQPVEYGDVMMVIE